ncbi:diacylglycerol kinase, partial [Listeria monocytogenes]|nr:diacylglycerol kinase [Listeria monocytogenes]
FHVTKSEWILLILSIFGVLTLEMVNTAIERAVDVATEQYIDEAKKAKDVAAGAVLLAAIVASFIGLIIFIPYFCQMFL